MHLHYTTRHHSCCTILVTFPHLISSLMPHYLSPMHPHLLFYLLQISPHLLFFFFFLNDPPPPEIYPLPLPDALPIYQLVARAAPSAFRKLLKLALCIPSQPARAVHAEPMRIDNETVGGIIIFPRSDGKTAEDRKSTRLNSSHLVISYAVFCLKKKK